MTVTSIVLAGVGGQGIVFAGRLLAHAAFREGRYVTLRYTYGSEVTGTPVHSDLKISNKQIKSPFIEKIDYLVVVHQKPLSRHLPRLSDKSILIVDNKVDVPRLYNVKVIKKPFVEITRKGGAGELGSHAIIAALGYLARLGVVSLRSLVEEAGSRKGAEENILALKMGYKV